MLRLTIDVRNTWRSIEYSLQNDPIVMLKADAHLSYDRQFELLRPDGSHCKFEGVFRVFVSNRPRPVNYWRYLKEKFDRLQLAQTPESVAEKAETLREMCIGDITYQAPSGILPESIWLNFELPDMPFAALWKDLCLHRAVELDVNNYGVSGGGIWDTRSSPELGIGKIELRTFPRSRSRRSRHRLKPSKPPQKAATAARDPVETVSDHLFSRILGKDRLRR